MSNHLVLDPGSNTIKCNVASYIELPEHQICATGWETETGFVPVEDPKLHKSQSIRNGKINDAKCFHDLLFHATIKDYEITRIKNDYLVAVLVPLTWTKSMIEETAQFMFEVCNFSGIVFLEQPLTTLYGYGVTSGLVLDMGYETCDIAAIFENAVIRYGAVSLPVGGKDVLKYLEILLLADAEFKKVWKKDTIEEKFLKQILETPDLILGLPNGENEATIIEINGLKIPISAKIRWSCLDVLFDPSKVGKEVPSLPQALAECISGSGEPDRRLFLWENIALSGGLAAISGIKNRIESECILQLAASETSSEFQAKEVGWLKIPDYFTNFRERPQDMGYVGGSVTAKCTFLSPINYITRADYNESGPPVVHSNVSDLNKMKLFVEFLQDNGYKNADSAESLSTKLEWISSLKSPFMSWLFERIESIPVLDGDEQLRHWNGLSTKSPINKLDHLEAEILGIKQETQNIESTCHELKLAMYDANQSNAALQAEIQQKRETSNFKDHNISMISSKINRSVCCIGNRIQDEVSRLNAKEYTFQKRNDIDIFKSSCTQNINLLLEKYHELVSEISQLKIGNEECIELDHLISTYPEDYMKQLKMQLKIVELQSQMEELEKRPNADQVLMNENAGDDAGLEVKFQISSNVNSLLKEIKSLLTQKAPCTITQTLHEKLSRKSILISEEILNRINLIQSILQNYSSTVNSIIEKMSVERAVLKDLISSAQLFEMEMESWKKDHDERMKSAEGATKVPRSLIQSNHPFVAFLDKQFGTENGSQSGEVTLLPIDGILELLQKQNEKWNTVLKEYHGAADELEKLTKERVYREQSLLQARLKNSEAPYILPHDKTLYELEEDVKDEVENLQKQLVLVTEKVNQYM